MYLVGDDKDVMMVTKIRQTDECLPVPYDAAGVMRIGENQHPTFLVGHGFKILKIHAVGAILIFPQRIIYYFTSVRLRGYAEGVVDGRLYNDLLIFPHKHVDSHPDTFHYSGNV